MPQVVYGALSRVLGGAAPAAAALTQVVTLAPAALIFIVFAVRQEAQALQWARQSALLLTVWVVLGSTHLRQWYMVWPIMIAMLLGVHPVTRMALWLGVGASVYYASPALVSAPLLKAVLTIACFAWPGWLLLKALARDLTRPL